jgi:hypothetical protein
MLGEEVEEDGNETPGVEEKLHGWSQSGCQPNDNRKIEGEGNNEKDEDFPMGVRGIAGEWNGILGLRQERG